MLTTLYIRDDIMQNPTLVIFVHELSVVRCYMHRRRSLIMSDSGNLRVEIDSATHCDVSLEHSYLVLGVPCLLSVCSVDSS